MHGMTPDYLRCAIARFPTRPLSFYKVTILNMLEYMGAELSLGILCNKNI
jgi:hypothetical protein